MLRQTSFSGSIPAMVRTSYQAGLSILIVLMPKCGLCVAAYLHLFSLFGVSLLPYYAWLLPLLFLLLLTNLLVLFLKAYRVGDYRQVAVAALGSSLVGVDKLLWHHPALSYAGTALLVGATGLQVWRYSRQCSGFRLRRFRTLNSLESLHQSAPNG